MLKDYQFKFHQCKVGRFITDSAKFKPITKSVFFFLVLSKRISSIKIDILVCVRHRRQVGLCGLWFAFTYARLKFDGGSKTQIHRLRRLCRLRWKSTDWLIFHTLLKIPTSQSVFYFFWKTNIIKHRLRGNIHKCVKEVTLIKKTIFKSFSNVKFQFQLPIPLFMQALFSTNAKRSTALPHPIIKTILGLHKL